MLHIWKLVCKVVVETYETIINEFAGDDVSVIITSVCNWHLKGPVD